MVEMLRTYRSAPSPARSSLSAPWGGEGRGEVGDSTGVEAFPPHPPTLRAGPSLSPQWAERANLNAARDGSHSRGLGRYRPEHVVEPPALRPRAQLGRRAVEQNPAARDD